MRLILVGSPGSGKGTQAELLSTRINLVHISTGDILREAVQKKTKLGLQVESYLANGKLVPDDLVNEVVAERFRRDDRPERFVMDGYPRTLAQAASFDQALRQQFLDLTAVILLRIDDEEIVRRMTGRRTCPACQRSYHVVYNPPRVSGICDNCGSKLVQRPDDNEETVRERLKIYHECTMQIIPHYRTQGLLREVDGVGPIEDIYGRIIQQLKQANS
jgi:adenylate kinase